jgi:hypothetical protein
MKLASLAALTIALLIDLSPPARSQPTEKAGRIGVIVNFSRSDPGNVLRVAVLLEGLRDYGWEEGKLRGGSWLANPENLRSAYRSTDSARGRRNDKLVARADEVFE